jgi:hypothetical protein
MTAFQFLTDAPKPGDDGLYMVMSDVPTCKIEIVDLGKNTDRFTIEEGERIYTELDGEGSNYAYKISVVDCYERPSDEQRDQLIESCWDWFLTYYLL